MAFGFCKGGPLDGLTMLTAPTSDGDAFAVNRPANDNRDNVGWYVWDGDYETFVFYPDTSDTLPALPEWAHD